MTVVGAGMIIFRRPIGYSGSNFRAWVRRYIPVWPESDEAYVALTGFVGLMWLIMGILMVVLTLAL